MLGDAPKRARARGEPPGAARGDDPLRRPVGRGTPRPVLEEGPSRRPGQLPGRTRHALVITIHAAKGLEFDVVFIAGRRGVLFPTGRAVEAGHDSTPTPADGGRSAARLVGMTSARSGCTFPRGSARRAGTGRRMAAGAVPDRDHGGLMNAHSRVRPGRGRHGVRDGRHQSGSASATGSPADPPAGGLFLGR